MPITDTVAAQVLKPLFGRLRPCHDPDVASMISGLVDCGGLSGASFGLLTGLVTYRLFVYRESRHHPIFAW
jgi:undecaprenyl-diphosphatase